MSWSTGPRIGLLAIVAVGAWLRFSALGFGLPDRLHPAERTPVGATNAEASEALFRTRALAAGTGSTTVLVAEIAASPAAGPVGALTAGAVVALATVSVRDAKLATPTPFVGLALTLLLALLTRAEVAVTAGIGPTRARARGTATVLWILGTVATSAGVGAVALFALLNPSLSGAPAHGWRWLAETAIPDGLGLALAAAFVGALLRAPLRRRPGTLCAIAMAAGSTMAIARGRDLNLRALALALPPLAVLTGALAADLHAAVATRRGTRIASALVGAALAAALAPSAIRDWKLNRLLERKDTRTLAREWIEEHVPAGQSIAVTHPLPFGKPQLGGDRRLVLLDPGRLAAGPRWVLDDASPLDRFSPAAEDATLRAIEAAGATPVLDLDPEKPGTRAAIYDLDDPFYVPLQRASSVKRPGPRIRIWRIDPN